MRFLVLGSTGMAGHMISSYLLERGHEVAGTFRREAPVLGVLRRMGMRAVALDVADPRVLPGCVDADAYEVIVNCIGILNNACDANPALAVRLNSLLPHRLEALSSGTSCRVIHISTDCVFAGDSGPYSEDSEPDGASLYDLSKAAGELRNPKDLTLRQSVVGPDPDRHGIGLLNWFMLQEGPVHGYARAMWTGLTTLELARAVEACAEAGTSGLVNMVPWKNISKFDLLRLFNRELRGGTVQIEPSDEVALDKTLIRGAKVEGFVPKDYPEQVSDLSRWMRAHRLLYPHYSSSLVE